MLSSPSLNLDTAEKDIILIVATSSSRVRCVSFNLCTRAHPRVIHAILRINLAVEPVTLDRWELGLAPSFGFRPFE